MTRKLYLLIGACAASLSVAGVAGTASAAGVTHVYGGGATLPAPYLRQALDCYGNDINLLARVDAVNPPTSTDVNDFSYTGAPAFDCSTTHVNVNATIHYIATGSGLGQAGFFSHDPSKYNDTNDPSTPADDTFPTVNYGNSDAGLGTTEVTAYNSGGTVQGVTVVAPGDTPGPGQYANPHEKFGAMVQVPLLIAPVVIAYDPVYKKVRNGDNSVTEYHFNVTYARADGSGGLRLDRTTYCKIFNGEITNWNDPALTALNGGKSLKDPADPTPKGSWSVPMQIVGRLDNSGTTSIWTRHLASVCASDGGNQYADGSTALPATLYGGTYDTTQPNDPAPGETLGKYTRANGNGGVAKYLDFTAAPGGAPGSTVIQGRIGYVGPDYALPAVTNTGANAYGLNTATVKNGSGAFIAPTTKSVAAAFGSLTPPDSNADGTYDSGSSDPRDRSHPQDWVEPVSKTSPLADPSSPKGYPIMGTTNQLFYSCYANDKVRKVIIGFINWYHTSKVITDAKHGLVANAGFAPLPTPWRTAIRETFITNAPGLNLEIETAGNTAHCSTSGLTGG